MSQQIHDAPARVRRRSVLLPGRRGRQGPAAIMADDAKLHEMGYPRSLSRRMTGFDNFAISFSIISILTGCMSLFGYGMNTGGPAVMVLGWAFVGGMTMFVGLPMAELASAFPTSGALYYWSSKLARKHGPAASWYTGWLNVAGQVGGTAGIDFGLALFGEAYVTMLHPSFQATSHTTILIYAAILVVHGLLNTAAVRLVALLNRVSVYWHLAGVAVLVAMLAIVPTHHQNPSQVFAHVVNNTGLSHHWFTLGFVVAIGLLMPGYTFCGFDASGHLAEETGSASWSAPQGIVRSIFVSWVAGFVLIVGFLFAIQDYSSEASASVPPLQILTDALGPLGGKLTFPIILVAMFFCGMSSVTANSRLIFAISRDKVLPGWRLWSRVGKATKTPTAAVWLATSLALVLGLPYLYNPAAFTAITSINVIGLFSAYGIPIFLRLRRGADFEPGPFSLGRHSRWICIAACIWICIEMVLFVLPQAFPITITNFNYAGPAVAIVLLLASIWWLISARRSYTGPISYGTPEELAALDGELV